MGYHTYIVPKFDDADLMKVIPIDSYSKKIELSIRYWR